MKNNNLKNLCIITGDYPTKNRPVFVFVQQLVETWVDMDITVNVVAPQSLTRGLLRNIGILPKHETYHTAKGNAYAVYRPYIISFGNGRKWLYKITEIFNQNHINSCLQQINPQVIYGHFWASATKALPYSIKNNKPLFVACGESYNLFDNWYTSLSLQDKLLLREQISGVICVSSENLRKCIGSHLCTEQNSIVLPNCVNINLFCPKDTSIEKKKLGINADDFTIVFVGGFIPRKGPDRIAKAIANLKDTHIKVMFIGNIFEGYNYDFDCPGIIYKGPLSHEQLPIMLNCANVFVLPTRNEGCCNAIVEALACGLPIISSNGSFNDDILDDDNSIRVDSDDIEALTKAIAYLRDNPEIRKKMQQTSFNRRELYSLENRAVRILNYIESHI